MVIGGGDVHCGLGSWAVGLEGSRRPWTRLSAVAWAAETGTVVVVVVVVAAVAAFFPGLKMA